KAEMKVTVTNLHFTCRPKRLQMRIGETGDGSFAQTSDGREVASHRGVNNPWLHDGKDSNGIDQKLKPLATALGLNTGNETEINAAREAIDKALERYDGQALKTLQDELTKSFQAELNDTLKPAPDYVPNSTAFSPRGNLKITVEFAGARSGASNMLGYDQTGITSLYLSNAPDPGRDIRRRHHLD